MNLIRFNSLATGKKIVVAIAVLLDGREAISYLANDSLLGSSLQRAAEELATLEPELRMPFVGTMLREAISEIEGN